MIRVAEAISDTNIGGAGVLLLDRLRNSDRKHFDITVILPKKSLLVEKFKEMGIKTVTVNGCADRSFDGSALVEYIRAIRFIRPHIVNSHGCLTSRLAARICNVPVSIYTRHCVFPLSRWQLSLPSRVITGIATDMLSDRVIAVAYSARAQLVALGVRKDMISVIINGAERLTRADVSKCEELREKLGIPKGNTVVGIFARLEPCKGHIFF